MFKLIPDDCVIVIRQNTTGIEQIDKETETVFTADSGFPGTYSRYALDHVKDYENPHEDKLIALVLPEGNDGKWLTLGENGVVITDEQPIFKEDIHAPKNWDTCVKTDDLAPQAHLDGVISEPFCVAGDKMRVKGDTSDYATVSNEHYDIEKHLIGYGSFVQPVLSANGTLGGSVFAVGASTTYSSGTVYPYCATNPNDNQRWQSHNSYSMPQSLTLYNPVALRPVAFEFNNDGISAGESPYMLGTYQIQASNDNSSWVTLGTFTNTCITAMAAGTWRNNVQTENYYKYFRIYVTKTYGNTSPVMIGYCRIITNDPINETAQVPNNKVLDVSKKLPKRMYYGTDVSGTIGFNLIPGEKVIP